MENADQSPKSFQLTIDLEDLSGNPADEISRILRYWGGNMKHYSFDRDASEDVYDSSFQPVGKWELR